MAEEANDDGHSRAERATTAKRGRTRELGVLSPAATDARARRPLAGSHLSVCSIYYFLPPY
jgi:hypothetical protein